MGLSWANGTLFSQLWSCSIESHGNTDEGPSTLYLPLLPLYPRSFYMEMYSICPGFKKCYPREMASSWRLCVEKPELMGQKTLLAAKTVAIICSHLLLAYFLRKTRAGSSRKSLGTLAHASEHVPLAGRSKVLPEGYT